jgi:glyoxylase-like metal-dependent hydrolase (beta-lactamase superfamily II)
VVDISEVAENIYMIDNHVYSLIGWGSTYLINEDKKALIDTGSATCAGVILDGVKKVGLRPEDIDYIIVTHVHLDHAGGAGVLIQDMPKAQVLVHHKGAKHLADPEKLVSSTIAAQGEEVLAKYGETVPIAADRIKSVHGGDTLRLSDRQLLQFIDAPGHAPHQVCIYENLNNGLFTGDALGIYMAESEILFPITPPPSFDPELYIDTLKRLMEFNASKLYFGHFGASSNVQKNLELAIHKIQVWDDIFVKAMKEDNPDSAAEKFVAQLYTEIEPLKDRTSMYQHLTDIDIDLNLAGFMKYHQDKNKAGKWRDSESNQGEG